jgi:hypothetical protein
MGLAELQAAASLSPGGGRSRLGPCRGVARAELSHVVGCLARLPAFEAAARELDLSVSCRITAGQAHHVAEPNRWGALLHLPLAIATAGAFLGRSVPDEAIAVGECDLAGCLYGLSHAVLAELTASLRAGELRGCQLLCPGTDTKNLPWNCGCRLAGADSLEGALRRVWPDLELHRDAWSH